MTTSRFQIPGGNQDNAQTVDFSRRRQGAILPAHDEAVLSESWQIRRTQTHLPDKLYGRESPSWSALLVGPPLYLSFTYGENVIPMRLPSNWADRLTGHLASA